MTDVAEMPETDQVNKAPAGRSPWFWVRVGVQVALMLAILAFSAAAGFRLRQRTWEFTAPIRFTSDIQRNLMWGTEAANKGYLNLYERQRYQNPDDSPWLDYAPIRLAVMWGWGEWVKTHYPGSGWQPTWDFHRPVLYTNMGVEAINALGLFLLVRLWVIRHKRPAWKHDPFGWFSLRWWRKRGGDEASLQAARDEPLLGCWRGLGAVLIGWFSPGILMSAYGWPTYDSWIVPAYVWAVLFASSERWFLSGLAVGIGAMAKGQILAVSPVFVLWPLFAGMMGAPRRWAVGLVKALVRFESPRPFFRLSRDELKLQWGLLMSWLGRPLRWAVGLLTGIATLASPWMFTYPQGVNLGQRWKTDWSLPRVTDWMAIGWVGGVVAAAIVALVMAWLLQRVRRRWLVWVLGSVTAVAIAVTVLWPVYREPGRFGGWVAAAVLGVLAIVLGCWVLPARGRVYAVPAAWGTALLLCVALFHGSWCWAECGWGFGMKHWPHMTVGPASNMPGMLEGVWEIYDIKATAFTVPAGMVHWWPGARGFAMSWKMLMNSLFAVTLVLSALGMARQARRGDAWFLVAQAAPWLVFFCFPVQVHERYLLFGAGVAFAAMGASTGMALLGYVLSIITMIMTASTAMAQMSGWPSDRTGRMIYRNFALLRSSAYPEIAWGTLVITAVFLWAALFHVGARQKDQELLPRLQK